MKTRLALACLAALLFASPGGRAAVTVNNYYRMGENDSGPKPGAASITKDIAGTTDITWSGAPFYSTDVSAAAAAHTGSAYSMDFFSTGGPLGSAAGLLTNVTDNFGIEAWIKPVNSSAGSHIIALNGNGGSSGWGLRINNGTYEILFGGVIFTGGGSVTLGSWTHVALVRASGVANLYVNGVSVVNTALAPNPPVGPFVVSGGVGDRWFGWMDEMRVFTFAAGQFSTNDLLLNVPFVAPTVVAQSATGVTANSATLNATVNPRSQLTTVRFQYGLTTSYGSEAVVSLPPQSVNLTTNVALSGLAPNSLYHFRVVAANSAGSTTNSDSTFTTPAAPPAIVAVSAGSLTTSNAVFQATINPNNATTAVYFVYGFDTNYGSVTVSTNISGYSNVIVSNLISYLFTGCTYHYAVVASSSIGTTNSPDATFTLPGTSTATVTTTADGGAGSLRQAIANAAGGGTINITVNGVITLTNPLPVIFKSLTINGPGAGNLTISGNNLWRPFFVDAGAGSVNINNLTLANGRAKGGNGGSANDGGGGGMGAGGALFVNAGLVTISNLVFSGNAAIGGNGGACQLTNTAAAGGGGGLGGNGGSTPNGTGGGGGFLGNGAGTIGAFAGASAGGGGGGFIADGGLGGYNSGGGGGAFTAGGSETGANGEPGGAGGAGGGGMGGTHISSSVPANGSDGQMFGGGGGGGDGRFAIGNLINLGGGWAGAGGKFGGGGGADGEGAGGRGGDFGGGGASTQDQGYYGGAGAGGFGGGGGASAYHHAGSGGFGGGGGGAHYEWGAGGPFGGNGNSPRDGTGGPGGGGAALGGAVFVRVGNAASVSIFNSSIDAGLLTPGAGFLPTNGPGAYPGQAAGSSIFSLAGTNVITITSGTNTIAGSIAEFSPSALAKNGNGTLLLSGTNNYSGSTFLNAGTLVVNGNNSSSSNLYVASGATLAGTGTVGRLTVNSGGTISPGLGALTAGSSVWSGAGQYNWQLYDATNSAGLGYGTIQINGTLDVSAASGFGINLWTLSNNSPATNGAPRNFPTLAGHSWILVHTTGGITGFNPNNFSIYSLPHNGAAGFSNVVPVVLFNLTVIGNDLVLTPVSQPFLSVQPVTGITSSNATLNALVNPYNFNSWAHFMWGTTTNYGATNVVSAGFGGTPGAVTNLLPNLFANTVYHYRILASNSFGVVTNGDQTFSTIAGLPVATTLNASNVTATTALLKGTVNPQGAATDWFFQYGLTASYGSLTTVSSLPSGVFPFSVSNALSGLLPGTNYHFRLIATNSMGTNAGVDLSFTTPALPPGLVIQPPSGTNLTNVTLNAQVTPNGAATAVYFLFGNSVSYGQTNVLNNIGSGLSALAVSNLINGLVPGTTYHYQIIAANSAGTNASGDQIYSHPAFAPTVVTLPLTGRFPDAATLNASVNPNAANTTVLFMYGTNVSYDATNLFSLGAGTVSVLASNVLTNLSLGIYHYQVAATNSVGATFGGDRTFTNVVSAQTITFGALSNRIYGEVFTVAATASSGLPVSYSVLSGSATISNDTVTATGIGQITIRAAQSGNALYAPATNVDQSFTADKAALTISAVAVARAFGSVTNLSGTITGVVNGDAITLSNIAVTVAAPAFSTKWGVMGAGNGQFNIPYGLALDANNNVFVCDISNQRVQKFDANGNFITKWGSFGTGNGQFNDDCESVTVDSSGNVYVVSYRNNRIWKFNNGGGFIQGLTGFAYGVAYSDKGYLYQASYNVAHKTTTDGTYLPDLPGTFNGALGIATDAGGQTYVVEQNASVIQKYAADDTLIGPIGAGQLNHPNGAAVDRNGFIYVSDYSNNRIVVLDSVGNYVTTVAGGGSGNGQVAGPHGVAIANNGAIYVADGANYRIQRFAALNPTALASNAAPGTYTILPTAVDPNSRLSNYRVIVNHAQLMVTQANQTISFAPMTDRQLGDAPFAITNAVASSGLAVTYSVVSGPATIAGNTITLTNIGVVTVRASQAGNANYNAATPVDVSFTVNPGIPAATLSSAVATTTNTATLRATINPRGADSLAWFEFGTTTNYGSFSETNSVPAGTIPSVTNSIAGLDVNTFYHVRAVAVNAAGLGASTDGIVSTWLPQPITLPATALGSRFATLNALMNTNSGSCSVWFEYGSTTNFGNFASTNTVTVSNTAMAASSVVTNLAAGSVYYFRSVAVNSLGTSFGQTLTLTTWSNSDLLPIAYYRLGENDPGAAASVVSTATRDSVSTNHLTVTGGATYSADVHSNAASRASSSLSMNFGSGTSFALGPRFANLTNNFGLEAWAKTTTTFPAPHWIAYNGNTGSSGWGIIQDGGSFKALFGGVIQFASGPAVANQWTHVALVRDNGVATLYVNGVPSGSTTNNPNPPANNFGIGTDPGATGNARFLGLIDEVRIFTFSPGQFTINDLLLRPLNLPSIANVTANNPGTNAVALSATVNPNGGNSLAWFEYGFTASYGSYSSTSSVPSGASLTFTNVLLGLQPGTRYHYRLVASNAAGLVTGSDASFLTQDIPRSISSLSQSVPGQFTLQFTGGSDMDYTILGTTNISLPLSNWTVLGSAVWSNGLFQFTDTPATNEAMRFYRLRTP